MNPQNQNQLTSQQNESPMAPPYVDENPNLEMTELGLRIAENERRDAVRDGYEDDALLSDETEDSLDDISYSDGEESDIAPEISAMKEQVAPDP